MKIYSLRMYAKKVGVELINPTIETIQEYVELNFEKTLWDYPLEELEYVLLEVTTDIVVVNTDEGLRLCEY